MEHNLAVATRTIRQSHLKHPDEALAQVFLDAAKDSHLAAQYLTQRCGGYTDGGKIAEFLEEWRMLVKACKLEFIICRGLLFTKQQASHSPRSLVDDSRSCIGNGGSEEGQTTNVV